MYLSGNCLDVHPAFVVRFLPMSKLEGVAVLAVNLSIVAIVKGGSVQICMTVIAREAIFMNDSTFGVHLFSLENFTLASDTSLWRFFIGGEGCLLTILVLTPWAMEAQVACFAIDLIIRSLDGIGVIEATLALDTSKAFLVIKSTLGCHFLCLKNLSCAPWAAILLFFCWDDGKISHDLRPVWSMGNF